MSRKALRMRLGIGWVPLPALILSLALSGCADPAGPAAPAASPGDARPTPSGAPVRGEAPPGIPTAPNPRLKTIDLFLGPETLKTELALSSREIQTGMMFRTELGEDEAMLFVFGRPHRASFWMKNTRLPLSCAYIDPEGLIREIHDMEPFDEAPIQAMTDEIQYVLEVRQGWFERHGIKPGTLITSEYGALRETFFRNR